MVLFISHCNNEINFLGQIKGKSRVGSPSLSSDKSSNQALLGASGSDASNGDNKLKPRSRWVHYVNYHHTRIFTIKQILDL